MAVLGRYAVESGDGGARAPPQGSECTVTPEGAQSCTQTVQVAMTQVDGDWRTSDLTLPTTS